MKYFIPYKKHFVFFSSFWWSVVSIVFCLGVTEKTVMAENSDIVIIENDALDGITLQEDAFKNIPLYFGESLNNFITWKADKDAFIFSNNIDFKGNEVLNFRIENRVSAPECTAMNSGRMYHNTTDTYSYICDASEWRQLDNDEQSAHAALPYLYSVTPNFLGLNKTADLKITGEGFQNITRFEVSNGLILHSFEILNSKEAILHVTTSHVEADVNIIGLNKGRKWEGNVLKVKVAASLQLKDVLENIDHNIDAITEWIPTVYPLALDVGPTADYIYDGGDNAYDRGNYLNTGDVDTGKKHIPYTDKKVVTDEDAFGIGGKYFTFMKHNIFILSATVGKGFRNFYIDGHLGANGNGSVDTYTLRYNGYTAYIKRVYGAGSIPSINHIFIVDSAVDADAVHEVSMNTNSDNDELKNLERLATIENNKFYYFAFALKNGKYIDDSDMRNLVEFIIDKILSTL